MGPKILTPGKKGEIPEKKKPDFLGPPKGRGHLMKCGTKMKFESEAQK